jgi:hypothetical protein
MTDHDNGETADRANALTVLARKFHRAMERGEFYAAEAYLKFRRQRLLPWEKRPTRSVNGRSSMPKKRGRRTAGAYLKPGGWWEG